MKALGLLFLVFSISCAHQESVKQDVGEIQKTASKKMEPLSDSPEKTVERPKVLKVSKKTSLKDKKEEKIEEVKTNPRVFPFSTGEILKFKAKARGFNVGTATFEVLPFQYQGQNKLWHFRFSVKTEGFINNFYSLQIRQESWVEHESFRPRRFLSTTLENKDQKHSFDEFNYASKNIKHTEKKNEAEKVTELPLPQDVVDSLSAFYLLRIDDKTRVSSVVHEGKIASVKISNLGKDGDLTKFSIEIDSGSAQYVWLDQNKSIKKVLIQTKNGRVELNRSN